MDLFQLLLDAVTLQSGDVVHEQLAVQVIDLVLDAGGEQFVRFYFEGVAVPVQGINPHSGRAFHLLVEPGHRQAAFFVGRQLIGEWGDLRVDVHLGLVALFGQIHHQQALVHVHLSGRQADAGGVVHGFDHVVDQFAKLVIYLFHRLCYCA